MGLLDVVPLSASDSYWGGAYTAPSTTDRWAAHTGRSSCERGRRVAVTGDRFERGGDREEKFESRLRAEDDRVEPLRGLEGFGRPGSYFSRQIARWTRQWQASKTREIPEIEVFVMDPMDRINAGLPGPSNPSDMPPIPVRRTPP